MNKYIIILSLLTIIILPACDKNSDPKKEEEKPQNPFKSAVVEQNNDFSLNIFKKIVESEANNSNVFISPLSMYYALAMAGVGSDGETKSEFIDLLGWNNLTDDEILGAMKELTSDLEPVNNNVKFTIANSLWQREGAAIHENYKTVVSEYFDAEVRELDFTNSEAVERINSWIEVKTNDLIQDMLDAIPPDAFMYLINAIYYKADWKYKFDVEDSYNGDFIQEDNTTIEATYMTQKTNLEYFSNNLFESVKLPYIDSNFYMTVFLPKPEFTANDVMAEFNSNNWTNWNSQYTLSELTITLPKFKFEYGVKNINEQLIASGLVKAFNSAEADFSLITDADIFISRVLHKALIEVNEEGSEAAAATIIEFVETSVGEELFFTANRPFIFSICHEATNSIIFMGKLTNP